MEKPAPLVALIGRPNSGKSSLYNLLSGGDAHVGNYPGVTVDILEADVDLPGGGRATLVDLPGVYSVALHSDADTDEGIARDFLNRADHRGEAGARPVVLMQVLDSNQLALGLRLTAELVRRAEPLLVVATQVDILRAEGRELDEAALQRAVGVPVVVVSARESADGARVLEALAKVAALAKGAQDAVKASVDLGDPEAVAARALRAPPPAPAQRRRRERTARLDGVLLHPVFGPLAFLGLMTVLFTAVFFVSEPLKGLLDDGKLWLAARLDHALGAGLLSSFLIDGMLFGAGTVLTFLPQIVLLTIVLELLEATGYLARGAFLIDRLLRIVGLGGRAFVPLLTGHACAVPAIAATRVIRDPRERLTTILVIPLMTCAARLPTYSLLIATFFASAGALGQALIFIVLYAAGIVSGFIAAAVLRRGVTRGRGLPLVLEMPAYRVPEARRVARVALRAARRFVSDVGTVILVASVILWMLLNIPLPVALQPRVSAVAQQNDAAARMHRSVAAGIGRALEPVTRPLGFDWRINIGLIGSFGARELMVSTLGVTFGIEDTDKSTAPLEAQIRAARDRDGRPAYGTRTALALLAFFVIACQCMSTVAAVRRETRSLRWPALLLVTTYGAAYLLALIVVELARMFGVS